MVWYKFVAQMIYPQREQRSRFIWSDILMRILPKQQKNGNKITFFKFLPQERRFHLFLFFSFLFFLFLPVISNSNQL